MRTKRCGNAYSRQDKEKALKKVGDSYAHLSFLGPPDSLHKVITLYRLNQQGEGSQKGLEIAFEMRRRGRLLGWLVFQVDPKALKKGFGLEAEDLENLYFPRT